MKVTGVNIILLKRGGPLRAYANVVFDDALSVRSIRIFDSYEGLRVSLPERKDPKGRSIEVVHAMNAAIRREITRKCLDAYYEALDKAGNSGRNSSAARKPAAAARKNDVPSIDSSEVVPPDEEG